MTEYLGSAGEIISSVLGWLYFLAWSVSFYPQVYTNWRRKSVVGLSFDYEIYNLLGFLCYSAFNISFYFINSIKVLYEEEHNGQENLVQPNDVFFSLHAVVLTIIILIQIVIYEKGGQRVSLLCITLTSSGYFSILALAIVSAVGVLSWLFFLYYISIIKLVITVVKYCPQAFLNWKRKSTIGWNILNVLLDFTGGVLSCMQLLFDAWRTDNWRGVIGDPVKFGLGFVSIFFDIIFMLQHYVLYPRTIPDNIKNQNQYSQLNEEEKIPSSSDPLLIQP